MPHPIGLILAALLPLTARAAVPPKPDTRLRLANYALVTRDYCVPSGLRISFQEDHSQPLVSVTSVIGTGSGADPDGKEGIAHVVEHLWFRSRHEGSPPTWDVLHQIGAEINAFTAADETVYLTIAPRDSLTDILKLEAARLGEAVDGVSEENIATEREVIRNELRVNWENSEGKGYEYIFGSLYPPGHPYHDMGIGTHGSLDNITLQDVQDFTRTHYTASNATVLVLGDFKLDETWDFVVKTFPKVLLVDPKNPDAPFQAVQCPVRIKGPSAEPPNPATQEPVRAKAGVQKTTVLLGWSLPGAYRPNQPMLQMTGGLLAGAVAYYLEGAREATELGDESRISCSVMPSVEASTALCAIELDDDEKPEKVITKAVNGLYQLWDVENREWQKVLFERSKAFAMAGILQTVEEVSSLFSMRGSESAQYTHYTGDAAFFSRTIEALSQVQAHEAAQLAEKYLNRKRYVAAIIEPYEEGDIKIDSSENQYTGHPREPALNTTIDLAKVDAAWIKQKTVLPDLSRMRTFTLANGLQVVLLPYGSNLMARTLLTFRGGPLTEFQPGLSDLSEEYTDWMKGVPGTVMSTAPTHIVGDWMIWTDTSSASLGVYGSAGNLEAQQWFVRTLVETGTVKVTELEKYVDRQWAGLKAHAFPEATYWSHRIARLRLLQPHPLSRVRGLTDFTSWDDTPDESVLAAMKKQSESEIKAWNRHVYRPANGTLYVVGPMDPDQAEAAVRRNWETWTVPGAAATPAEPPPGPTDPPARQVMVFDDPIKSQTEVTVHCQLAPATATNSEARTLLAAVLDELVWVGLRESGGYTYGANAFPRAYPGGTALLTLTTNVQNDAAVTATGLFLDVIQRAKDGTVDPKLLTIKKMQEARSYVLGQQTTDQMLTRISSPGRYGYGFDFISGHADRLAAVGIPDLQAQVDRCVGHEVVTLTGPASVLKPLLDKSGLPYDVVDWKAESDKAWEAYDPKGFARSKK